MPAKSLPIPQRSGPILSQAGQMPARPPLARAGGTGQRIGAAMQEAGGQAMEYAKWREQERGKRDERSIAQAKLNDMIERRKLAMRIQQARERWQNAQYDLQLEKEGMEKEEAELRKESHVQKKEGFQMKKAYQQNKIDFGKEFNRRMAQSKQEGGVPFTRTDAHQLANLYEVGQDENVLSMIDKYWRRPRTAAGAAGRKYKREMASRMIPMLESQLQYLAEELKNITGSKYEASKVIQDPYSLEREIQKIPQEMAQQSDIMELKKEIRKKIAEIDKAKAEAGMTESAAGLEGGTTAGMETQIRAIEEDNQLIDERIRILEEQGIE